jgi:hypothetical protein
MSLRKALGVFSFLGALGIGAGAAYVVNGTGEEVARGVYVSYMPVPQRATVTVPNTARYVRVDAADLIGTWTGTWGYGGGLCTIDIHRIDGTVFYGTLKKDEAVISLEGYIDPETRRVSFKETKVLKVNAAMGKWSLGINSGTFSPDGRSLTGTGTDEWGTYGWGATKSR